MIIRDETVDDHETVRDLLIAAFGGEGEARLVDALRADGDLPIALVAEQDGAVAGFIALSRLREPAGALALAPLAVGPQYQRTGI
ncbi:MAG TPA: GNAT family N-acetyltransferase, partial [Hyphomicrobium sp.]|nr:GNAT family N-acetyltransferase [Hyphomicrobium sp.]